MRASHNGKMEKANRVGLCNSRTLMMGLAIAVCWRMAVCGDGVATTNVIDNVTVCALVARWSVPFVCDYDWRTYYILVVYIHTVQMKCAMD